VTVARTSCYVNRSAEQFPTVADDDVGVVDLAVDVKNASPKPAVIEPSEIRLEDSAAGGALELAPQSSSEVTVNPGKTETIPLEFKQPGGIDRRRSSTLDLARAIKIDGAALALSPIRFTVAR
jgi:hypothetical protein